MTETNLLRLDTQRKYNVIPLRCLGSYGAIFIGLEKI